MATNQIVREAKNISLAAAPAAAKNKFCEIWPTAKTALTMLRDLIKNPALKVIIGVIIALGDAVASRICG